MKKGLHLKDEMFFRGLLYLYGYDNFIIPGVIQKNEIAIVKTVFIDHVLLYTLIGDRLSI